MNTINYVTDTVTEIQGELYNLDFDRFAINPRKFSDGASMGDPDCGGKAGNTRLDAGSLALRINDLISSFATAPSQVRRQTLKDLIRLHEDGLILWPLSMMIGKSALGNSATQRISAALHEELPHLAVIRSDFEGRADLSYARKAVKSTICMCMWQFVVGLRFATTDTINGSADFKGKHFETLMRILKQNGVYRSEVTGALLSAPRALAEFCGHDYAKSPLLSRGKPSRRMLGASEVDERPTHLGWVVRDWGRWVATQHLMTSHAHRKALSLFLEFLLTVPEEVSSVRAKTMSRNTMKSLLAFASSWSTPSVRFKAMSKIKNFCEWLSVDSMGDGEHPEFTVMLFDQDLEPLRLQPSSRNGENITRDMTRPMPAHLHSMMKRILLEDDFRWARQLKDRQTGALTQYMTRISPGGEVETIFCPVLSRMLLLHLDMPFRNVQIRRLDSGEGDDRRWNPGKDNWQRNTGPNAGHWRRVGASNVQRGVFRAIRTEDGTPLTGFWVNSNKTQDRRTLFDEHSGYEVPWENEESLNNLAAMRDWQEQHNAVDGPMPHAELDPRTFVDDPTPTVQALIPDRFYLFRYPMNIGLRGREQPPSHHVFTKFYHRALEELQRQWNQENPERKIKIIESKGRQTVARFTLHGMRAATLTELHKAGVPVGIISKLVAGHASILMTFKYFHYEPQHVSELINAARVQADSLRQSEFEQFLKGTAFEEALLETASIGDGRPVPRNGRLDLTLAGRLDYGICPNGGTRCNDGGPKSGNRSSDKFTEVPGGSRNCVRCRHFVTGAPFLVPLLAHANALLAKGDGFARQAAQEEREVLRLKGERALLRHQGKAVPEGMNDSIHAVNEAHLTSCSARDRFLADSHVAMELVQKVRALGPWTGPLPRKPGGLNLPTQIQGEVPAIEGRNSTRFEVTDFIVQASRFYPSLASQDAERERDGMTTAIFVNHGYMPTWLMLEPAKRRRVTDALARLFLEEVGAAEVDFLIDGTKTMSAGLEDRFRKMYLATAGQQVLRVGHSRAAIALEAEA